VERLILDTSVLVAVERRSDAIEELIGDEDDVAIAAVTAAELLVGVERADDRHRPRRAGFVTDVLETVVLVPYDVGVARAHAALLAHAQRAGRQRGAHDLIIAATAATGVATARTVLTADAAGFADLPGVRVLVVG